MIVELKNIKEFDNIYIANKLSDSIEAVLPGDPEVGLRNDYCIIEGKSIALVNGTTYKFKNANLSEIGAYSTNNEFHLKFKVYNEYVCNEISYIIKQLNKNSKVYIYYPGNYEKSFEECILEELRYKDRCVLDDNYWR